MPPSAAPFLRPRAIAVCILASRGARSLDIAAFEHHAPAFAASQPPTASLAEEGREAGAWVNTRWAEVMKRFRRFGYAGKDFEGYRFVEHTLLADELPPHDYLHCHLGGTSGPTREHALDFGQVRLPRPPFTIAARVRTTEAGHFQTIVGWGAGSASYDSAALRLDAMGNLQYGCHDGYAWHHAEARPAVNLQDGSWHFVAAVHHANGLAELFVNGTLVGAGRVLGTPRPELVGASSARTLLALRDLPFLGEVHRLFVWSRALLPRDLRRASFVPCRPPQPRLTRLDLGRASEVHNNIGDLSAAGGESALRLFRVAELGGVPLDLKITNTTVFRPAAVEDIGLVGGGGGVLAVNLQQGTSATLRFQLVASGTNYPVQGHFFFSFLHVGEKEDGTLKQSVKIRTEASDFWVTPDAHLETNEPSGNMSFIVLASSTPKVSEPLEEIDPLHMSSVEEQQSFSILVAGRSGFEATLSVEPGRGRGDFGLAGGASTVADGERHMLPFGVEADVRVVTAREMEAVTGTSGDASASTYDDA